jgi:hypothetical protein
MCIENCHGQRALSIPSESSYFQYLSNSNLQALSSGAGFPLRPHIPQGHGLCCQTKLLWSYKGSFFLKPLCTTIYNNVYEYFSAKTNQKMLVENPSKFEALIPPLYPLPPFLWQC